MAKRTPGRHAAATQELASVLLDQDVIEWIQTARAAGTTWATVRDTLAAKTGGRVDVTDATLRNWINAARAMSAA